MYITYEKVRYTPMEEMKPFERVTPRTYIPTKLVRVSDMQVVSGTLHMEYWCLSYSFNQSGDIVEGDGGKFMRVDKHKHQILWPVEMPIEPGEIDFKEGFVEHGEVAKALDKAPEMDGYMGLHVKKYMEWFQIVDDFGIPVPLPVTFMTSPDMIEPDPLASLARLHLGEKEYRKREALERLQELDIPDGFELTADFVLPKGYKLPQGFKAPEGLKIRTEEGEYPVLQFLGHAPRNRMPPLPEGVELEDTVDLNKRTLLKDFEKLLDAPLTSRDLWLKMKRLSLVGPKMPWEDLTEEQRSALRRAQMNAYKNTFTKAQRKSHTREQRKEFMREYRRDYSVLLVSLEIAKSARESDESQEDPTLTAYQAPQKDEYPDTEDERDEDEEPTSPDDKKPKTRFDESESKVRRVYKNEVSTSVSFERLIQEICKDLGIQYIWYDQMCINHDDEEEKLKEMKNMHRIYKNAICTLALVPELQAMNDPNRESRRGLTLRIASETVQWSKSIWTLQEAYSSKNIAFVGRNTQLMPRLLDVENSHVDAETARYMNKFLRDIEYDYNKEPWTVCMALSRARQLTTRKPHEWIFALANIFPELIQSIPFTYDQPIIQLLKDFYHLLVEKDISILLFGKPLDYANKPMITQEQAKQLPSWTGASGAHLSPRVTPSKRTSQTFHYRMKGSSMRVRSNYVLARIALDDSVKTTAPVMTLVKEPNTFRSPLKSGEVITDYSEMSLTFAPTQIDSPEDSPLEPLGVKETHILPLKTNHKIAYNTLHEPTHHGGYLSLTEECSECYILTGLEYHGPVYNYYPVIKKVGKGSYKFIGMCIVYRIIRFTFNTNIEKKFKIEE